MSNLNQTNLSPVLALHVVAMSYRLTTIFILIVANEVIISPISVGQLFFFLIRKMMQRLCETRRESIKMWRSKEVDPGFSFPLYSTLLVEVVLVT